MPAVNSNTAAIVAESKVNPDQFTAEYVLQEQLLAAEKLSAKQIAFVDEYVSNGFRGANAYKSAKYKVKNDNVAAANAARLLVSRKVQDYLRWKLTALTMQDGCEIDEGRLIREAGALAHSSLTDVIEWDAEGRMTLKPSCDIPREVAASIKKFRSVTKVIPVQDGDDIEETRVEIEMHDKKGALDLLAKIAGMLRDTKEASDFQNYTLNMYFGPPPSKEKDVSPV